MSGNEVKQKNEGIFGNRFVFIFRCKINEGFFGNRFVFIFPRADTAKRHLPQGVPDWTGRGGAGLDGTGRYTTGLDGAGLDGTGPDGTGREGGRIPVHRILFFCRTAKISEAPRNRFEDP